jgi:phosphoglycerol transferase MdoB-like AlkP superfamily enzyme
MDEYPDKDDFDGTWAIYDEPYLKYFADQTNKIARNGKPFFFTVFTASSHEPFPIPDEHKNRFTRGEIPMHRSISYADYAIRQYFEKVKNQPWFNNTIFIFTADHCGVSHRADYNNEMGRFLIPIFFYTPGGQLPAKCDSTRLMQQTDITPTLLAMLNYQKPFFSFGKNVFDTSPDYVNFVFNDRNGASMYYLDDLMIEYRSNKLYGIFEFKKDFSLKNNLIARKSQFRQLPFMQRQIEAIIQQYITRMKDNNLTATKGEEKQ